METVLKFQYQWSDQATWPKDESARKWRYGCFNAVPQRFPISFLPFLFSFLQRVFQCRFYLGYVYHVTTQLDLGGVN